MKNETLKGVFVIRGLSKKKFTQKFNKQSRLGGGPQQREIHPEIQQAKQDGVGALSKENFTQKFNKQSKLGWPSIENHATSMK
ncbi:hypothetical protein ACYCJJ_01410 [Staphylococcus borealis]|uniref:hypothetical protein n=1 Tax=Staphylococcus borealis TaxID=2742203 RepID=UPI0025A1DD99|nr:hypothetical protein [Staphylococcus borealis]